MDCTYKKDIGTKLVVRQVAAGFFVAFLGDFFAAGFLVAFFGDFFAAGFLAAFYEIKTGIWNNSDRLLKAHWYNSSAY